MSLVIVLHTVICIIRLILLMLLKLAEVELLCQLFFWLKFSNVVTIVLSQY